MKAAIAVLLVSTLLAAADASSAGGGTSACSSAELIKFLNKEVVAWQTHCNSDADACSGKSCTDYTDQTPAEIDADPLGVPDSSTPGKFKPLQPGNEGMPGNACCVTKPTDRCTVINDQMAWAEKYEPPKEKTSGAAICTVECVEAVKQMAWNACFWSNWNAAVDTGGTWTQNHACCAANPNTEGDDTNCEVKAERKHCYHDRDGCVPQLQINAWAFVKVLGEGGCMPGVNWGYTLAVAIGSSVVGILVTGLIGRGHVYWSQRKTAEGAAKAAVQETNNDISEDDADAQPYEG